MTNALDLLNAYEDSDYYCGRELGDVERGVIASRAFSALRAVITLHSPQAWYEECDNDDCGEEHFYAVDQVGIPIMPACAASRVQDRCQHCTPEDADELDTPSVPWPCHTLQMISTFLEDPNA